jgi:predicted TIM-barrel fold metal-dependent hydrolase
MMYSMDRANVRLLCFTPHAALFAPDIGNRVSIEAVRKFPTRLRAYLAINPHYPDQIARDLAAFDANSDVFIGLKFLSDYHRVPMTAPVYEPAWKFAAERRLPVLAHTWCGSQYDGEAVVRKIAAQYPDIPFLLGHSLHGAWDEAAAIAKEFPNVYLELTALLDNDRGVIEKFVAAGLSGKMLFGTDLPWFSEFCGIGSILSADITDEDRHNILHRNAEELLGRTAD